MSTAQLRTTAAGSFTDSRGSMSTQGQPIQSGAPTWPIGCLELVEHTTHMVTLV